MVKAGLRRREILFDHPQHLHLRLGWPVVDAAGFVAEKTVDAAKATKEGAKKAGEKTAEGAKKVGEKTGEGAKKAGKAIKKAVTP